MENLIEIQNLSLIDPQLNDEVGEFDLAKYIKNKRLAKGLSQKDVAEALGYTSAQFISNWERNKCQPPKLAMKTLVKLLDIDPQFIAQKMIEKFSKETYESLGLDYLD